jgi:hypothetical protein
MTCKRPGEGGAACRKARLAAMGRSGAWGPGDRRPLRVINGEVSDRNQLWDLEEDRVGTRSKRPAMQLLETMKQIHVKSSDQLWK